MTGLKGPATDKQLALLRKLDVIYHPFISKQEASDAITEILNKKKMARTYPEDENFCDGLIECYDFDGVRKS